VRPRIAVDESDRAPLPFARVGGEKTGTHHEPLSMSKHTKRSRKPGNFNLAVRRSRTGLGLFAAEPIPRNACVIEYTGRHLTDEEYNRSRSRYLFDLGNGKVLDGSPRWNKARYINHSCVPNCEPELHKGR